MVQRQRIAPRNNPDYGSGLFRRSISLRAENHCVEAQLEDNNHAFKLTLIHDGKHVTDIQSQVIRYPFATCPQATDPLRSIIGFPVSQSLASRENRQQANLAANAQPGNNCTHLFDLACLAIDHFRRGEPQRRYDITVTDEQQGVSHIEVSSNDKTIHSWQVKPYVIIGPDKVAGGPLTKGFFPWAKSLFQGVALEAAQVLQRGYFVAQTRRYDYESTPGRMALDDEMPEGTCYSYNAGIVERAVQTRHMIRDFSYHPAALLKFVP